MLVYRDNCQYERLLDNYENGHEFEIPALLQKQNKYMLGFNYILRVKAIILQIKKSLRLVVVAMGSL